MGNNYIKLQKEKEIKGQAERGLSEKNKAGNRLKRTRGNRNKHGSIKEKLKLLFHRK
jgi:hypothetical protein